MAKKYHQSKKRSMDAEMYSNDSGMINSDHSSMANMPQNVMMKEYPKMGYGLDPYLNDTQSGIDNQIGADISQMKRHISKSKY